MDQLSLNIEQPTLTGQAALRMIPQENVRRLLDRGQVRPGVAFYVLHNQHGHHVWSGRGKMPAWVSQYWNDLDALKAVL